MLYEAFIHTMTVAVVLQLRNLEFWQELTVSKVHYLEMESVPVM